MTDFDDVEGLQFQGDDIDFEDDVASEITKHAPPEIEYDLRCAKLAAA